MTLLLEAPTEAVAKAWATAAVVLFRPWRTLLSSAMDGGQDALARVRELRESLQPHLPLPGGARNGAVASSLGPRGGRYILRAFNWLSRPTVTNTTTAAAGAVDQVIPVPVVGLVHRLGLLAVQAGALAVLADECISRLAAVNDQSMCVLDPLLEHTVEALQRDQAASSRALVEWLCDVIGRLDAVLVAVEGYLFVGRFKGNLISDVEGWENKLRLLHNETLGVSAFGAAAHQVDVLTETVSLPGHAMGVQQDLTARLSRYRARFDARGPDTNYVSGEFSPGRAEHAIVSALREYVEGGGAKAPLLGVCAVGGSAKSTAAEGVAACSYVREKFSSGVVWVQLNHLATAETVVDAVVALVHRFCGEDAALRLLDLKVGDDLVGIAAGYVQAVPASTASKYANWFVIIDDVMDKTRHLLAQLLRVVPASTPVLFTTRAESVASSLACQRVPIDALPAADARLLLARLMGRGMASPFSDEEEAAWVRRVVDKTKGHALSLHLVGRMIARRNGAWRPVMEALEERWMDPEFCLFDDELGVPLSVSASLDASIDLLPDAASRSAFKGLGVLPTSVEVSVDVLERLWRPLLESGAAVEEPLIFSVRAGARGVAPDGGVNGLTDVLFHAGLLRHIVDGVRGVVASISVHPVLGEYARFLLGNEHPATHGRLVEDYMREPVSGGPGELIEREYPFWRTADDGYFYDNLARHAAASEDLSMLLSLARQGWRTARVRTCAPLACQADVEIVLPALLAVKHDTEHKVRQAPAQLFKLYRGLGLILLRHSAESRADNVDDAVACYREALEVRTRVAAPLDWAKVQNNLGNALRVRVHGDRAANVDQAIACFHLALEERTLEAAPRDWASTQNNLGIAYLNRVRGDRAGNVENALRCYKRALEVRTWEAAPLDWAATQNNLGSAYVNRVDGDRVANVEEAIACYMLALGVRTRVAAPLEWALTQYNLANAYLFRVHGGRSSNVEEAVAYFERALEVWTREAAPRDWAKKQNSLGNAFRFRLHGDRAADVDHAIACFHSALEVQTREAMPLKWASTQNNLGSAYRARVQGDRAANVEQAIACFQLALEVRTRGWHRATGRARRTTWALHTGTACAETGRKTWKRRRDASSGRWRYARGRRRRWGELRHRILFSSSMHGGPSGGTCVGGRAFGCVEFQAVAPAAEPRLSRVGRACVVTILDWLVSMGLRGGDVVRARHQRGDGEYRGRWAARREQEHGTACVGACVAERWHIRWGGAWFLCASCIGFFESLCLRMTTRIRRRPLSCRGRTKRRNRKGHHVA